MDGAAALPVLLAHALVDLTREADGTGRDAGLDGSLLLWADLLRAIPDEGIFGDRAPGRGAHLPADREGVAGVGEARLAHGRARRCQDEGRAAGAARSPDGWRVGAHVPEVDRVWRARVGQADVDRVRRALESVVGASTSSCPTTR